MERLRGTMRMFSKKNKQANDHSEQEIVAQVGSVPARSKKKPNLKIVIPIVVVVILLLIIGLSVLANQVASKTGIPVSVKEVTKGTVEEVIDVSGMVASEESKTYFAETGAEIETIEVQVGDTIKANTNVVTFDVSDLELAATQDDLQAKATDLTVKVATKQIDETLGEAAKSIKNYDDATKYVNHYNACLQQAQDQLLKANEFVSKKAALDAAILELKVKLETTPDSTVYKTELAKKQAELKEVEKQLANYDVAALQNAVDVCRNDLTEYKALQKEYEAGKKVDATLSLQKEQQNVQSKINQLTKEQIGKDLEIARKGVVTDFDGIITSVDAVEGQMVTKGSPLFTIQNDKKVKVVIELSKYDLEKVKTGQVAEVVINGKTYAGEVTKINRLAKANQAGATMVSADIHISEPDENVFLGIEAKVHLTTATAKDVYLIPVECVNYDNDGVFCYLVKDKKVVRQEVEVGISSDTFIEIKKGLQDKDQIIAEVTSSITEGMSALPMLVE